MYVNVQEQMENIDEVKSGDKTCILKHTQIIWTKSVGKKYTQIMQTKVHIKTYTNNMDKKCRQKVYTNNADKSAY